MKRQYCSPSRGISLLNKNTNTAWRTITSQFLYPNMCVATILPAKNNYCNLYPILAQSLYLPKGLFSSNSTPEQLYKYLHISGHQALKIMPSVKYAMEGIKISMMKTLPSRNGLLVIEGTASLRGDMVVKPKISLNPLGLSISDKSGRINLTGAMQAKNDFIASLGIKGFIPEGRPS